MNHRSILTKQMIALCLVAGMTSCVQDNDLLHTRSSGQTLQIAVAGIEASNEWGETVTRSASKQEVDLTEMPVAIADLGDNWVLTTHIAHQYTTKVTNEESPQTRGTLLNHAKEMSTIAVGIYNSEAANFSESTSIWKRVQSVNTGNTGNWSMTGEPVNWPLETNKLSLLAFSPYPTGTVNGIVWESDGRSLTYTAPVDVINQPDICVAVPVLNRPNPFGSNNHVVPLQFKHALAAISLKAIAHRIKIISATLKNIKTKGTLDLTQSAVTWSNVSERSNRALAVNESVESSTMVDITNVNGHLLVPPQTLDYGVLEFVFDDLDGQKGITKAIQLKDITPKWEAGQQIFYNLRLKAAYDLTLNPNLVELSYEAGSYKDLSYKTNNPNPITVEVDRGWITNLKVDPATGKISFDYSENPSLETERIATITVTSGLTVKTVKVIQGAVIVPVVNSNCYLLAPGGKPIHILVKRANADRNTRIGEKDMITAELIWQDTQGAVGTSASCIQSYKAIGVGESGMLEVVSTNRIGNAVIAIKVNGRIRWSWHIWVTPYDPEKTNKSFAGFTWMDRNLGATTNAEGDLGTVGMFYQWGRKDAFPGSNSFSYGQIKPIFDAAGRPINVASGYQNGTNSIENSIENPLKFYGIGVNGNGIYQDWINNDALPGDNKWRENLWLPNMKTVYDPCPLGWRVPPPAGYDALKKDDMPYYSNVKGCKHSVLGYFPLAGNRAFTDGSIGNLGTLVFMWTSTANISTSGGRYGVRYLELSKNGANPNFEHRRTNGHSVRCIKETP